MAHHCRQHFAKTVSLRRFWGSCLPRKTTLCASAGDDVPEQVTVANVNEQPHPNGKERAAARLQDQAAVAVRVEALAPLGERFLGAGSV